MRITELQLQLLLMILNDSVRRDIDGIFSVDYATRRTLLKKILEQQSDSLIEVTDE